MTAIAAPPAASLDLLDDPIELARFTRWVQDREGRRLAESALQVSGMHCAACADAIEHALQDVDGVASAEVSAAAERATVRWDPQRARVASLLHAVRGAGYDAVPDAAAPARGLRLAERRRALWRLFVAWFCMMQVMMLATPSYVAGPGDLTPDLQRLLNWGQWVLSLPVLAFAATPFFDGALRALRQRRIAMDVPVALGLLVAFVASSGAAFDPAGVFGHEVYFDSLTMFVSFLLAARWYELRLRHRAVEQLERSLAARPQAARRVRPDGGIDEVSVHRLQPGDRVQVPLGEAFPADGVVVDGATRVDEALLTGESEPVRRAVGDAVIAGAINRGATVQMRVERVGADTRFELIVAMMQRALTQRPAAARVADRWAGPFLWAVLALAAGAAAVWSVLDPSRAVWVAVSVLIVTCPCALSLAAPSVLVAAAGGLARRGVMLQRLEALESLARVDHVFVDKTGTLTEDALRVTSVHASPEAVRAGVDEDRMLAVAAALARASSHPLARALAAASTPAAGPWSQVQEVRGQGIEARDGDGRKWRLGAPGYIGAGAHDAPPGERVGLSCDGVVLGGFHIEEALRDGAADGLRTLRAQGLKVSMLSGDSASRAETLAAHAGVNDVVADASPERKLQVLQQAQAEGARVWMLGDGINDAPVLACADVSMAMGQGALVARAQADAVVVSGRWADIVHAHGVARRAVRLVHQNLGWAALYNASCIPLAAMGYLPPWAAGLGMAMSSLLVVANATRAGR